MPVPLARPQMPTGSASASAGAAVAVYTPAASAMPVDPGGSASEGGLSEAWGSSLMAGLLTVTICILDAGLPLHDHGTESGPELLNRPTNCSLPVERTQFQLAFWTSPLAILKLVPNLLVLV